MALHLEEVPEFRCTINLVPSLLVQIEAYVDGRDRHAPRASRGCRPTASSTTTPSTCSTTSSWPIADAMIRPHPRYHELYHAARPRASTRPSRPCAGSASATSATSRSGRTWPGCTRSLFEKDPELAEFKAKGRHYTEDEKHWLLDKQRDLLGQIIPLHRKLADRGQVELTTTPFYHPILPLLLRQAARPRGDARRRPARATATATPRTPRSTSAAPSSSHREHFGERPAGHVAERGLGLPGDDPAAGPARHPVDRHRRGDPRLLDATARSAATAGATSATPSCSTAPGRSREAGHELAIVFRDHSMSDQVGFHYQRSPGPVAAADFLGKLHAIGDACRQNPATLVPVILDGENCWEYYPDGGVSFLRSLYQGAVRDPRVRPVTVGEFLREHPAGRHPAPALRRELDQPQLRHLDRPPRGQPRPGTPCTRPAQFLVERGAVRPPRPRRRSPGPGTRSTSPRAPTGSGGTATTTPAPSTRCSTTCSASTCGTSTRCSATTRPASLFTPISQAAPHRPIHDQPNSFLQREGRRPLDVLRVDQRRALRLRQRARDDGAGRRKGLLQAVWFGFDAERLLIRVDTEGGPAPRAPGRGRPAAGRLRRPGRLGDRRAAARRSRGRSAYINHARRAVEQRRRPSRWPPAGSSSWPSRSAGSGCKAGDPIRFYVELLGGDASLDRAPREGIFELTVPSPDFERIMWQV